MTDQGLLTDLHKNHEACRLAEVRNVLYHLQPAVVLNFARIYPPKAILLLTPFASMGFGLEWFLEEALLACFSL